MRRLLIFTEISIADAVIYEVFEPDDDFTRQTIVNVATNFLQPIKNARGLIDFSVVSGTINNSSADIDQGILNVEVLVKPQIPAKFIQILTAITNTGANFQEYIMQS